MNFPSSGSSEKTPGSPTHITNSAAAAKTDSSNLSSTNSTNLTDPSTTLNLGSNVTRSDSTSTLFSAMLGKRNNGRKRAAAIESLQGQAMGAYKRQFLGGQGMPTQDELTEAQSHQNIYPFTRHCLTSNHQQQSPYIADYPSRLMASILANRQEELAQRQLLSRYFSDQFRSRQLASSVVAPSVSTGLGGLPNRGTMEYMGRSAVATAPGHLGSTGSLIGPNVASTASTGGTTTIASTGGTSASAINQYQPLSSLYWTTRINQLSSQHLDHMTSIHALLETQAFQTPAGASPPQKRLQNATAEMTDASLVDGALLPSISASSKEAMLNEARRGSSLNSPSTMSSPPPSAASSEHRCPIPLGIDEDPNWLSDFHVFVRAHLVELCWVSSDDAATRNAISRVSSHQVGIRCRCCAHFNPPLRAQRSSAFPSSIAQIYQSFTMMLRAHFTSCTAIPFELKQKFLLLKSKTTQGATDSKQYWIYSACKLGMVDSEEGIVMTNMSKAKASTMPPFGYESGPGIFEVSGPTHLVVASDRPVASDFWYTLLLQARRVRLQKSEQRGNKKSLPLGLPGFACRHCCQLKRMGQCRIFPARRRTLPTKIHDLYDHLQRCTACPRETKELLGSLYKRESYQPKNVRRKEFLDIIWARIADPGQQL